MEQNKGQKFVHYSIQFACLQKLKKNGLITADEYEAIKKRLMSDFNIVSNIAA
ncbi:MAG: SHOCT domain-containing protein [Clostridiales bacterium]|nr:SHOCT domain-containing protein [Clostridiales bacterium]